MKAGAHDFFPKGNLPRLGAAIERELREVTVRKERTHALAELRRAEERHRLIVENVRDYAIFMLDRSGTIASWNRGAERLTGYAEHEVQGRPLGMFYAEEERRAGVPDAVVRDAARHGAHVAEGWRVRRDGSRFWAECTVDRIDVDGSLDPGGEEVRGVCVLVVDDDPDIRDTLVEALEEEGYSVAAAANGSEALETLRRIAPRLILLDLFMPIMGGQQFRARQLEDGALADTRPSS